MFQDQSQACPTCGHHNRLGAKFCGDCGARIDGLCPNCGTQNTPDSHYCDNCGHELALRPDAEPAAGQAAVGVAPVAAAGAGTPIHCPRCQQVNEPGSSFCFNCGLPFEGDLGRAPTWAGPGALAGAEPVGFWVRFVALIIDGMILSAVFSVGFVTIATQSLTDFWATEELSLGDYLSYALSLTYATVLVGIWATTVGKKVFNASIVQVDGSRVGFGRALGREAAKVISGLILGIGFLMVAFRADKRGLHDLIAGTVVVKR